jgi:hypothetical protein
MPESTLKALANRKELGLAMLWATGKLPVSVEEVNALFRRLAMPGVKAALR